jgi:predicted RNase H-like HicB family nuclease
MKNRVKEYLDLPYSKFVVPDVTTDNEPCYVAYHPELEGCMSHGSTPEEALRNLAEVTELYISTLLDKGLQIPPPQGIGITWDVVIPASEVNAYVYAPLSITPPTFVPVT